MNKLNKMFLRVTSASRWKILRMALDGNPHERRMARLCLRMIAGDYNKNHSSENGQFIGNGGGGSGGSSVKNPSNEGVEKPDSGSSVGSKPKRNIEMLPPKQAKRAHEVSNAIVSGKSKLQETGEGSMNSHMPNTADYRREAARLAGRGYTRSYFSEDYKQLVPEIKKALKNREAQYKVLHNGTVHAKIDLGHPIGFTFGADGKSKHETTVVTVVHTAKENKWHFYPDD